VLEIRAGGRHRAGYSRIERPAHASQEQDGSDPGADLEAPVTDVLVWHAIASEME
jgi:hypothetical protein